MFNKRWVLGGFILLAACFIAGVVFWRTSSEKGEWVSLRQGEAVEAVYGLGTLHADQVFTVRTGTLSRIEKLFVKEGQFVKKGDLLLTYNNAEPVYAPFSGVITTLQANDKEINNTFNELLSLVDLKQRYILVSLDQDSVLKIAQAKEAVFGFEALSKQPFKGKITAIYPKGSSFFVRIVPDSLPDKALPGMTTDVAILLSRKMVWEVPIAAVHEGKLTYRLANQSKTISVELGMLGEEGWAELKNPALPPEAQVFIHKA